MPIGGWGGWQRAVGSSMVVRNSVGEEVTVYCVLDSDYYLSEGMGSRLEEAASKGIQLHIWKYKEIENYLLAPAVVRRLIVIRIRDRTVTPSVDEIGGKLLSLAEDLKDVTVEGIADRCLAVDRRLGAGAFRKARELVASRWSDPTMRLRMVSGKEVLSRLSNWATTEFGVSFGAAAVRRASKEHEIPSEVGEVVRAIEEGVPFQQD